jgi:hypothetical protein
MHDRDDSPWYPNTIRLFRQTNPNNWEDTIAKMVMELSDEVVKVGGPYLY